MADGDHYGRVTDNTIQFYTVTWDAPEGPQESDRFEDGDAAYLFAEELLRKGVASVTVWLRNEYVPQPLGSDADDDPTHTREERGQ